MRIVIVEDNKTNLMILSRLAAQVDGCEVVPFTDPRDGLHFAFDQGCDLVLVDYFMPMMDGIAFIRRLRSNAQTADIPAVMVTSEHDRVVRQAAINAGATDFVTKPVDPVEIKARVRNLLELRHAALRERARSAELSRAVAEATAQIADREKEMVFRLARAIEVRDGGTGSHVERISHITRRIGGTLGLPAAELDELYLAAPMHDVGKIALPDAILVKPGPLTRGERQVMQRHTLHGHAILVGSHAPLLQKAAEIALSHHERPDGSGYPHGLKGNAIPLSARIVAVADVFDALTTERPYKRAWPVDEACDYLRLNSGTQFDPPCVDAFLGGFDCSEQTGATRQRLENRESFEC